MPSKVSFNIQCILPLRGLDVYSPAKNIQKSKAYEPLPIFPGTFNTHTAIDKKIHGRKRRIASQGFSDVALRSSEPFILDKVRKLCQTLYSDANGRPQSSSSSWSGKKNMSNWSTSKSSQHTRLLPKGVLTFGRYIYDGRRGFRTCLRKVSGDAYDV